MGKALIAVVAVALAVYSLFDVIATPRQDVRVLPKALWIVTVLIIPIVGPLAWLLLGTRRQGPASRGPGPRRPRPLGPDDDPDYLRGL
jgi:hypothetical protein